MKSQDVLITILLIGALVGIIWSTVGLFSKDIDTTDNTPESYRQAVSAELEDKCQTPDGYTDDEWQEHMSHHPDRYKECFN